MRVLFRTDASQRIGLGHVARCLTLAESLRERGVQTGFITRRNQGDSIDLVSDHGIPVLELPSLESTIDAGAGYAAWLGVSQEIDAEQTIEALRGEPTDVLVVDHYGIGARWERLVRPYADTLMVVDDLADREHDCDILLDQNYSASGGGDRYAGLVPEGCRMLIGPRYALLRPEYLHHRASFDQRPRKPPRVFVFLGGADPDNVTGMALEALSEPNLLGTEVDVVVGASNPHRDALVKQASDRALTRVHGPRPHLADLMAAADIAIGAGGGSMWERMCVGLPSVVIAIADNQRPACEALAEQGLTRYAGFHRQVTVESLNHELSGILQSDQEQQSHSERCRLLVDGLGTLRVSEIIDATDDTELRLRPALESDVELFFAWANEPSVRAQALNPSAIPWSRHRSWFAAKLIDPACQMFVLEARNLPVGQIRFDREGDHARVDYSLDVIARGRGWGARLVSMGAKRLHDAGPAILLAEVKEENAASLAVFGRLGFHEMPSTTNEQVRVFTRSSSPIGSG
jgi:UDP-2,4-diacetamido-2,4,6-trideoxy-beta-L-altropyranose hydrolase